MKKTFKDLRSRGQRIRIPSVSKPPSPRTVRPVVSGAYGCKSIFICKVGPGCHLLVPKGSKKI